MWTNTHFVTSFLEDKIIIAVEAVQQSDLHQTILDIIDKLQSQISDKKVKVERLREQ